ncbi:uncharacterized protein LOC144558763 [Carex rostrata]
MVSLSHQATILFILLVSFHIGLSLSSSATTFPSSSLFQSQKTKNSSKKGLLSSIDKEEKLSGSKSPKKKSISDEKEENLVSTKPSKKKLILEEKFQKPISSLKSPRKKLISEERTDEIISNSKLAKKKSNWEEKLDKVSSGLKSTKKKLTLKEEVEKLLSSSDTKPLKKKTNVELKEQKDQTKPVKPKKTNSTASTIPTKIKLSKLNSTTNSNKKSINSTKTAISKPKLKQPKNEGTEDIPKPKKPDHPLLLDETDSDDIISDLPDLIERLSITSKAYITAANFGIAEGVKPFLGRKSAQIVAPVASALFLVVPLLLLITLLKRLGSCLSLVRHLLVFIQAYLAIYFATLAVTALVTGLEPLRFFYATSPSSYTWTQVAQSLGYVVYLVLQLVDLLAVFSSSASEGSRALALAQMLVGLAVGLHYYAAVFHRAVMGEPPRANWHVHGVYSMCFMLICVCARAERRKKAYVGIEGTEEWKKS